MRDKTDVDHDDIAEITNEIKTLIKRLRAAFNACGDTQRAGHQKRYLKSPYRFYGIRVPVLRSHAKSIRKEHSAATREFVYGLANALWGSEFHEEKTLSLLVLEQYPAYLDLEAMPAMEKMLSEASGWDHLDFIAIYLVGGVLEKNAGAYAYLHRWGESGSHWMRRASLISQILQFRKGGGDRELFYTLAESMLHEKEFFIRKAIGWSIRELVKTAPKDACAFLIHIGDRASNLTMREGAKGLPAQLKKELNKELKREVIS